MEAALLAASAAFPETMASIGVTAASSGSFASILGGIGTAVSTLGSIAQGKQQAAAARYNAQVQENNAKISQQNAIFAGQQGAANAEREAMKTRANVGAIKAAQAAGGIDVNTGSAVDVRSSAAELGELNAITIRSNAARMAYGQQTQAASDKAQAALDRQEAKYDAQARYIGGATTLLSSGIAGKQSGLWDSYRNSAALNGSTYYGG